MPVIAVDPPHYLILFPVIVTPLASCVSSAADDSYLPFAGKLVRMLSEITVRASFPLYGTRIPVRETDVFERIARLFVIIFSVVSSSSTATADRLIKPSISELDLLPDTSALET